jgi:hypothetical protein
MGTTKGTKNTKLSEEKRIAPPLLASSAATIRSNGVIPDEQKATEKTRRSWISRFCFA